MTPLPIIVDAVKAAPAPNFVWRTEAPENTIGEISEDYIEQLEHIDPVAVVAYAICCVEWIYWFVRDRIEPEDQADYEEYLMALWVWVCCLPRRVRPRDYLNRKPEFADRTVFKDAVEVGIGALIDAIEAVEHEESAVYAAFVTQLCEYVLPREAGFSEWREEIWAQLESRFPPKVRSLFKVRVARQLFDTEGDPADIDNDTACAELVTLFEAQPNRYLPLALPS